MGDLITQFFQDLIPSASKRLGTLIKWIFLKNRYTYNEILNQNWNGRIGVLFVTIVMLTIVYFSSLK